MMSPRMPASLSLTSCCDMGTCCRTIRALRHWRGCVVGRQPLRTAPEEPLPRDARVALVRRAHRRWGHLPDPRLAQSIAHRVHRVTHLGRPDCADAAHAERLDLRKLAGIENEALVADAVVELLEAVLRVGRSVEGDDDRGLDLRIEKNAET